MRKLVLALPFTMSAIALAVMAAACTFLGAWLLDRMGVGFVFVVPVAVAIFAVASVCLSIYCFRRIGLVSGFVSLLGLPALAWASFYLLAICVAAILAAEGTS